MHERDKTRCLGQEDRVAEAYKQDVSRHIEWSAVQWSEVKVLGSWVREGGGIRRSYSIVVNKTNHISKYRCLDYNYSLKKFFCGVHLFARVQYNQAAAATTEQEEHGNFILYRFITVERGVLWVQVK